MRVLIADDSKMMRAMHMRSLRQAGYDVEAVGAGDGAQALAAFDGGAFDLLIVDWNMPGVDGVAFVEAARSREQARGGRRTPIMMITSQSTDEQMLQARRAGVDSLLTKPVTAESLALALHVLLTGAAPAGSGA